MTSKRRERERSPARKLPYRAPRRRLLAVCEGAITEPSYIKGYERAVRNASVQVVIPEERGDPRKVVEIARRFAERALLESRRQGDPYLAFDEIWCVFDRDEHPRFQDACQMAQDNGFGLAVSNPCFELWLLLHFRESPGARHRHAIQDLLRTFVAGYDKHVDFAVYAAGAGDAASRAERLDGDALAVDEAGRNPTTSVYKLTASISRKDSP